MKLNVSLKPKEILEKSFNIDAKGYRPPEVDAFLDIVIQDYSSYNRFINTLARENNELIEENNRLKNELRRVKIERDTALEERESSGNSTTNLDILKRLSKLEKIVYNNVNDEEEE